MASYSVVTTALALGAPRKRIENLLVRGVVPGARKGRQGSARRLSRESVVFLAAVLRLQDQLGVAAAAAASLLPAPGLPPSHTVRLGPIVLIIDFAALAAEVGDALAAAVEMAPRPRRGRPRARV